MTRRIKRQQGVTTVEYITIAALIALVAAPSLSAVFENGAVDLCKSDLSWYNGTFEEGGSSLMLPHGMGDANQANLGGAVRRSSGGGSSSSRMSTLVNPIAFDGPPPETSVARNSCQDLWNRHGGSQDLWSFSISSRSLNGN